MKISPLLRECRAGLGRTGCNGLMAVTTLGKPVHSGPTQRLVIIFVICEMDFLGLPKSDMDTTENHPVTVFTGNF